MLSELSFCEGCGDVVGVVTPHLGGVAQAFHGDQVVELRVQLAVQVDGKEEDRKGQVEVEEEKRLKEVRSWMSRLDRDDTPDEVSQNNKQKVATGLLLDKLRTQDFAGPLSSRAPRVLGPISRHRIADILPDMKRVSRASRPGLLVGFLRILCNGVCTARRFHTAENVHTCRIGCPDEPGSLTHYTVCPRLYNICLFLLETCYDIATKNLPVEPSVRYCGSRLL